MTLKLKDAIDTIATRLYHVAEDDERIRDAVSALTKTLFRPQSHRYEKPIVWLPGGRQSGHLPDHDSVRRQTEGSFHV